MDNLIFVLTEWCESLIIENTNLLNVQRYGYCGDCGQNPGAYKCHLCELYICPSCFLNSICTKCEERCCNFCVRQHHLEGAHAKRNPCISAHVKNELFFFLNNGLVALRFSRSLR